MTTQFKSSNNQVIDVVRRNGHGIYLLLTIEAYTPTESRKEEIDGWKYNKEFSNEYFAVYGLDTKICLACRGTLLPNASDVWNDTILAFSGGCNYPRAGEARELVNKIKETYTGYTLTVTGHSLGGGVARCLGEDSTITSITFNPACPPLVLAPTVGSNVTTYHIVFDFISAWMGAGGEIVYRLDMGFRPNNRTTADTIKSITEPPHSIYNFMKGSRPYQPLSSQQENDLWQNWFNNEALFSFKLQYRIAKLGSDAIRESMEPEEDQEEQMDYGFGFNIPLTAIPNTSNMEMIDYETMPNTIIQRSEVQVV